MLTPLYIAGLIRAELLRTRSMAAALARNLGHVLDSADRVVPFALSRLDDLLADDIIRLLGCLQRAQALNESLGEHQITQLALRDDHANLPTALPTSSTFAPQVAA